MTEESRRRSLYRLRSCCWWMLLLLIAMKAEATICLKLPAITVKEVEGVVVVPSTTNPREETAVPGMVLSLFRETPEGKTCVAQATTDEKGRFRMEEVPPGVYTIMWEAHGFSVGLQTLRVRRFTLRRNADLVLVADPDVFGCGGELELR